MKQIRFIALTALIFLSVSLQADPNSNKDLEKIDITPVVDAFRSSVVTLTKPGFVYNWSQAYEFAEFTDALGIVRQAISRFWNAFGRKDNKNFYGIGLYAALDPVASVDYGGKGDEWLLIEMMLPRGFRMLDLSSRGQHISLSPEAEKILRQFNCHTDRVPIAFFDMGGKALSPECASMVRKVFETELKIDGFVYGFFRSSFENCSSDHIFDRAFVIINPNAVSTESVRLYNSRSTKDLENRIRIQTLFFKQKDYMQAMIGPASRFITKEEAETATAMGHLLWKDLEGKEKTDTATITHWLKDMIFGCSGELPYDAPTGDAK